MGLKLGLYRLSLSLGLCIIYTDQTCLYVLTAKDMCRRLQQVNLLHDIKLTKYLQ